MTKKIFLDQIKERTARRIELALKELAEEIVLKEKTEGQIIDETEEHNREYGRDLTLKTYLDKLVNEYYNRMISDGVTIKANGY